MKRKIIASAAALALLGWGGFASAQTKPASAPPPAGTPAKAPEHKARIEDQYKLLLDRSIFSKERMRGPRPPNTRPSSGSSKREPQVVTVFTGVMVQDGEFVAFFENRQSGEGLAVHEGESLAGGKVSEISLDWLKYVSSTGQSREIRIGQNLTGEAPPTDLAPIEATSAPTSSVESPNDSAAEKMRKRRMRELGQ